MFCAGAVSPPAAAVAPPEDDFYFVRVYLHIFQKLDFLVLDMSTAFRRSPSLRKGRTHGTLKNSSRCRP